MAMPSQERHPSATVLARSGRFLFAWVKSLGLYATVVAAGTLIFLTGSTLFGYLPYSDRPGPGWGRGIFSWSEVRFFIGWLPLLFYCLLYFGLALFPFAWALTWFRSPRWLLRLFCGLFSGTAALISVSAAGWYIAISPYCAYAGGISGMVYGAVLLPFFSKAQPDGPMNWKHWTGIAATVTACAMIIFYPLVPKPSEQSIQVLYYRVVPGSGDLSADPVSAELTADKLGFLKSIGLNGSMHVGMSVLRGNTPTAARAVIVFTGELRSRTELREPLRTHALYVQQGDEWKMYPPNTPTTRNKIKFWPSATDSSKIEEQIDPALGNPSWLSWYPPIHDPR